MNIPNRKVNAVKERCIFDDVLIAIPSKNRADILQKYTASTLSGVDFTVFVESQYADDYSYFDPVVLPGNDKGLMHAMVQIKKYAQDKGYEYVLKCDDDVFSFSTQAALESALTLLGENKDVSSVCYPSRNLGCEYHSIDPHLSGIYLIRTTDICELERPGRGVNLYQTLDIWQNKKHIVRSGYAAKHDYSRLDGGFSSDLPKKNKLSGWNKMTQERKKRFKLINK